MAHINAGNALFYKYKPEPVLRFALVVQQQRRGPFGEPSNYPVFPGLGLSESGGRWRSGDWGWLTRRGRS